MDEKYEGIPITIGKKKYVVPPLSFKGLKSLRAEMDVLKTAQLGEMFTDEQADAMIKVIHAAVSRNYPDITEDDLAEMIDFGNVNQIIGAIYANSGLASQGGATAGSGQIGTSSTAT
jgi:hypothetical protein